MARETKMPYDFVTGEPINLEKLKAFEALVRADERNKQGEALKLAHGYLDRLIRGLNMDDTSEAVQVRDAIKQARAAPTVQEPVAWMRTTDITELTDSEPEEDGYTPLYTTPPAQPAPVQEPVGEFKQSPHGNYLQLVWKTGYVANLGDKLYTTPPAQPAPVQELTNIQRHEQNVQKFLAAQPAPVQPGRNHYEDGDVFERIAAMTTPPAAQRQWVGLTDEERDDLLDNYITAEGRARAIEAKLKEKNT
jgi:hypothetical protein